MMHILNKKHSGPVAQLVEQRTENPCVGGSSPPWATLFFISLFSIFFTGCQEDPCELLCQDITNRIRDCEWSNLTSAELRSLRVSCQNRWVIRRGNVDGRILEDAYQQCNLALDDFESSEDVCDELRAIYLAQEY